jgi:cytochrome P450
MLAMAMFPDAQRRAREELDSVVGGSRLPDFSDQELLPYLGALLLESLRWNPVAPLGIQILLFSSFELMIH